MPAGLLSSGGLCPWLVDGLLLPESSHHLPSVCVCVLTSFYKDTGQTGLRFTLMISFNLKDLM